jgi:putative ABC transport system permease protein
MLRSHLKIAIRNILSHKFYAFLNISGLALGLTTSILIGLYIHEEFTFDSFHEGYENIYHVGTRIRFGGQDLITSSTGPILAPSLVQQISGIKEATRLNPWPLKGIDMHYGDKAFSEHRAIYADSNFFDFFSFTLLQGNRETALKEPHSIVLTPAAVKKYFGTAKHPHDSVIGKIITVGQNNEPFIVTGIVEPAPTNSHIQYDMLLSLSSHTSVRATGWGDVDGTYTYFKTNANTSIESLSLTLDELMTVNIRPEMESSFNMTFEEFKKQGNIYAIFPYPLSESHLYHPEITDGLAPGGNVTSLYMVCAVGVFILLIACINFMNLATARSARRAREVGLRGSAKSKLVMQFLTESAAYVFTALVLALVATILLLPSFEMLSGQSLSPDTLFEPTVVAGIVVTFALVALFAGSYPAFYLTSFKPIDVLKGKLTTGLKSKGIRSVLVILQFSISIVLMICTLVVHDQLTFMRKKDVGLDKNNVLVLQKTRRLGNNLEAFKESVTGLASVATASYADTEFPEVNRAGTFRPKGTKQDILLQAYHADYDHLEALKIDLAAGRFFSKEFPSDSGAVVLNEAAVNAIGWTDPLNEQFEGDNNSGLPVIGVIRNFNFESFKSEVRPLIIMLRRHDDFMHVRYSGNASETVAAVESVWKKLAPDAPFVFKFLDQNFDQLFREEQRLGKLFTVLSSIAIFIACLGLLGLASFTAEQRTREIGIRKVMGASVSSVTKLLSKEFMILVLIACILACPVGWYAMNEWLSSFAYRIELSPIVFILCGVTAAVIAWLTVSFHFIRAAGRNPCDAIRHE